MDMEELAKEKHIPKKWAVLHLHKNENCLFFSPVGGAQEQANESAPGGAGL